MNQIRFCRMNIQNEFQRAFAYRISFVPEATQPKHHERAVALAGTRPMPPTRLSKIELPNDKSDARL